VAAMEKPVYTYYPETTILHPLAAPQLLGKPHTVTAHVTIPEGGAEGVLACFGGEFGGWSMFVQDGKLKYVHNHLKLKEFTVESNVAVPTGEHKLSFKFVPTEKSLKPDFFIGDVSLMIDGKEVGKLEGIKSAGQYSAVTGYGLVTGRNPNTPVSHQYETPFEFTGELEKVTIVVGK
jgi:arylsulfatase